MVIEGACGYASAELGETRTSPHAASAIVTASALAVLVRLQFHFAGKSDGASGDGWYKLLPYRCARATDFATERGTAHARQEKGQGATANRGRVRARYRSTQEIKSTTRSERIGFGILLRAIRMEQR